MLFNSVEFLLFGALFFALWPVLRKWDSSRWGYLVAASFFFYGWWDWRFIFLIIGSGLIDYFAALAMLKHPKHRKTFLVLSVVGNLGSLAVFKYLTFLLININSGIHMIGLDMSLPIVKLTLPIGISFYTFQSMSYTIDVYKNKLTPTNNILHFFAYLSMFPQLVAGPIVRAADLLPQLKSYRKVSEYERWEGLKLIVHGYFKKVVIADNFAPVINAAFDDKILEPSMFFWWIIVTMFAFQIYCDFSGYSDIARGLAKWMGYEFNLNFNHPYTSTSFADFWRRWHISLSSWFADYVYHPLLRRKMTQWNAHKSMWITMFLSGLWHGAAWHFVIWGLLHAFYISVEQVTRWPKKVKKLPGGRYLAALIVVILVWIAWVFFRAKNLGQAVGIIGMMFDFSKFYLNPNTIYSVFVFLLIALVILREIFFLMKADNWKFFQSKFYLSIEPIIITLMIAACIFIRGPGSAFIYFQF
ncbi:MAG: MBOAT family protein [Acidobacteria bacterium]|nr:MBOAT family protein [Acidobacteriota bacterium]